MDRMVRRFVLLLAAVGLTAVSGLAGAAPAPAIGEMSLGDPKAKVTVIEYASLTCPHCARFNAEVFPEFKRKYVDTGKVRYVLREFLTSPQEVAAAGFLLARCAGKDRYFDAIDAMFRAQAQMYESGDARAALLKEGHAAGLKDEETMACTQDQIGLQALSGRVENAMNVEKIDATPTFLIGGKKIAGEQTLEQLDAALAPLLAK